MIRALTKWYKRQRRAYFVRKLGVLVNSDPDAARLIIRQWLRSE